MATRFRELKVVTGDFARVQIFPVRPMPRGRRPKNKPSSAAQEKINQTNRERLAADILNLNFTRGDSFVKLDFFRFWKEHGREPESGEALRAFSRFIRKLRKEYKKRGVELKYFYSIELGVRGERTHVHVVLNKCLSYEELCALWDEGGVYMQSLVRSRKGICELGEYFVKQRYLYRSFGCSRNLKRPTDKGADKCIYRNDGRIRERTVSRILSEADTLSYIRKLYPGWEVAEQPDVAMVIDNDTGELRPPSWGIFITIYLYRPEAVDSFNIS